MILSNKKLSIFFIIIIIISISILSASCENSNSIPTVEPNVTATPYSTQTDVPLFTATPTEPVVINTATPTPTSAPVTDTPTDTPIPTDYAKEQIRSYLDYFDMTYSDLTMFKNGDTVIDEKNKLLLMFEDNNTSGQALLDSLEKFKTAVINLEEETSFIPVSELNINENLPDLFTFKDNTKVLTASDWTKRHGEISELLQFYMYGPMPDYKNEKMSVALNGKSVSVTIETATGLKKSFSFNISIPTEGTMPEEGWPIIIGDTSDIAPVPGFATASFVFLDWAADDSSRTGWFYDLYPYGASWTTQTGVLMAWAYGADRTAQAIQMLNEQGKLKEYDGDNVIFTGISRYGKAAACGVFGEHIKGCMPVSAGVGATSIFRYSSINNYYDLTDYGGDYAVRVMTNEPFSSLQSVAQSQWFNTNFLKFSDNMTLPFDQHFLLSLCADKGRYMFLVMGLQGDNWQNPPATYLAYLAAKPAYILTGNDTHIGISFHSSGSSLNAEDKKLFSSWFYYNEYNTAVTTITLEKTQSTVYSDSSKWLKKSGSGTIISGADRYKIFEELLNTQLDVIPEAAKRVEE